MKTKLSFINYIKLLKESGIKPKFNSISRLYNIKLSDVKETYELLNVKCKSPYSKYNDFIIRQFNKGINDKNAAIRLCYGLYRNEIESVEEATNYVKYLKDCYDKLMINEYYKMHVSLDETNDKLSRTFLIKKNMCLFDVAATILESVEALFYHLIIVEDKIHEFVSYDMIEENYPSKKEYLSYFKFKIKDLCLEEDNKFVVWYDLGDNWQFNCVIEKDLFTLNSSADAICLDGNGLRICEDNKHLIYDYLEDNNFNEVINDYDLDDEFISYYLEQLYERPNISKINRKIKNIIGKYSEVYNF